MLQFFCAHSDKCMQSHVHTTDTFSGGLRQQSIFYRRLESFTHKHFGVERARLWSVHTREVVYDSPVHTPKYSGDSGVGVSATNCHVTIDLHIYKRSLRLLFIVVVRTKYYNKKSCTRTVCDLLIEYILSPECLRDIKNRDKKPRRSRGFVEVFYKSRKHEGEVCILFKKKKKKKKTVTALGSSGPKRLTLMNKRHSKNAKGNSSQH